MRVDIERRRREAGEIPQLERQVETLEQALKIIAGEPLPAAVEEPQSVRPRGTSLVELVKEMEAQGPTVRARIIRALVALGKPMTVEMLQEALNREGPVVSLSTLISTIQRECRDKSRRIARVDRGLYGLREWGEIP